MSNETVKGSAETLFPKTLMLSPPFVASSSSSYIGSPRLSYLTILRWFESFWGWFFSAKIAVGEETAFRTGKSCLTRKASLRCTVTHSSVDKEINSDALLIFRWNLAQLFRLASILFCLPPASDCSEFWRKIIGDRLKVGFILMYLLLQNCGS